MWNDANNDGIKDPLEPGIENVAVELLTAAGVPVGVTTEEPALRILKTHWSH